MLSHRPGLAGDLRSYLELVFRNAPEALLKIGLAGQQKEEQRGKR
jgi:hypothetical protein